MRMSEWQKARAICLKALCSCQKERELCFMLEGFLAAGLPARSGGQWLS